MQEAGHDEVHDIVRFVLESTSSRVRSARGKPVEGERYENTAGHSWQIAPFALPPAKTLELSVDAERVVTMLFTHDLGEIGAGDKFVFAQDGWQERKAVELRAVERIVSLALKTIARHHRPSIDPL